MCPVEKIELLRGIGSQHFKEQNLNEARNIYLEIGDILKTLSDDVIIEQKYYQFYSNLALVDYQLRNFEDAIKFSTLCIKYVELASADFVKGHYYLIRTLYALGQEFEARELLEKARKRYPDQPTLKALKLSKNESEFEIESLLGEGNFTQVLRVTEKTLNKKFAMKIAQRQHLTSKGYWEAIYMEKHCLNRLIGSPYFNRLYWHFENGASVYLCLDYGPQIEVWAFLHLSGLVDLNFGASLFLQICSALEYVHDHDIVHRDLKCENIMLSGNRQIKLIDFGTARDLSRPDIPTFISTGRIRHEQRQKQMQKIGKSSDTLPFEHYVGTPQFMPPESIQNEINDKLSDLWSLGCLFFQMLSGYPPFHAASEYLIFQKIMPDKVWNSKLLMASYTPKLEWGIGVDTLAQDLVSQLVRPNRADRLSLAEIPKHEFFQQTRTKRSPYTLAQLCLSHCSQCYQPYESKPKLGGWIGDINELVIDDIDKYTFLSTASKNGLHRIHFSQLYFKRNRQKDPADDGWTVLN